MQALYGYFVAEESLREVKRNELMEIHALDPAKHDFSDKALFEARKKQAVRLFNANLLKDEVETDEEVEKELLDSVNDALRQFHRQLSKEATDRKNEMLKEAHSLWDAYLKLLILPIEIEHREKLDQEKEDKAYIAKAKKHYPFIGNELVKKLKDSELLQKEVSRSGISWSIEVEEIKGWYREQIRTAESLKPYFDPKGAPRR